MRTGIAYAGTNSGTKYHMATLVNLPTGSTHGNMQYGTVMLRIVCNPRQEQVYGFREGRLDEITCSRCLKS